MASTPQRSAVSFVRRDMTDSGISGSMARISETTAFRIASSPALRMP